MARKIQLTIGVDPVMAQRVERLRRQRATPGNMPSLADVYRDVLALGLDASSCNPSPPSAG